jgi:pimeloyl-ACP methyl ester carboxylesterase/DNA-binding NarL/FixJ family response regulator
MLGLPSSDSQRAVVDCIYSSAIEPGRFEYLIDTWDRQLRDAGYSTEALSLLGTSALLGHVSRATEVAHSASVPIENSKADLVVNRIQTAAFTCSRVGEIKAANKAAGLAFNIAAGMSIADLHLSTKGREQVESAIQYVIGASDVRQEILRLQSQPNSRLIYAFITALAAERGTKHALIVTTEHVWNEQIENAFRKTFKFTPAEVNVLRLILSGFAVAEIASNTRRSEATIRSQIHGLLAKTSVRSQPELLSLTFAFQEAIGARDKSHHDGISPPALRANPYETLNLPDGRQLDYLILGDRKGRPFVWLHGNLSQCRLPRSAEAWLRDHRIAMVVPIRAGYGFSSHRPKHCEAIEVAIADIRHLNRHLKIGRGVLVAHGNDFRLACIIAHRFPSDISRIIGIGAAFPIEAPEDYERLSKWARLFRANARYAPNVIVFLARCTYALVKAIGFESYVEAVMKGTLDAEAFRDPEIRAAVIAGSEILFGCEVAAAEAFAADTIAVHRDPWPRLENVNVPVTLIHGEQDPNCSYQSARDYCDRHAGWQMKSFPDAGHFVHHVHWRHVVQTIAENMPTVGQEI